MIKKVVWICSITYRFGSLLINWKLSEYELLEFDCASELLSVVITCTRERETQCVQWPISVGFVRKWTWILCLPDRLVTGLLPTKLLRVYRFARCDPLFCWIKFHPSVALTRLNWAVQSFAVKMWLDPSTNYPMERCLDSDTLGPVYLVQCHLQNRYSIYFHMKRNISIRCDLSTPGQKKSIGFKWNLTDPGQYFRAFPIFWPLCVNPAISPFPLLSSPNTYRNHKWWNQFKYFCGLWF